MRTSLICVSACWDSLLLLSLHLLLVHFLWTPGAHGNHSKWWTCNDACARCARRALPMEEIISQLYPGLFSPDPPLDAVAVPENVQQQAAATGGNYSYNSRDNTLNSPAGAVNGTSSSSSSSSSSNSNNDSAVYVDSIAGRRYPSRFRNPTQQNPSLGCCET